MTIQASQRWITTPRWRRIRDRFCLILSVLIAVNTLVMVALACLYGETSVGAILGNIVMIFGLALEIEQPKK